MAQPRLHASGYIYYDDRNDPAKVAAATNIAFIVPATVELSLPNTAGSAYANYGSNHASGTITGPHYPCGAYFPLECAGNSSAQFLSTWSDRLTITGASSNYHDIAFTFEWGGVTTNTLGIAEIIINDYSFFTPVTTNKSFTFGPIRFTNGVPLTVESRLAGGGGLAGPVMTGAYFYQHLDVFSRLSKIILPDGAVVTSESGHVYPTNSDDEDKDDDGLPDLWENLYFGGTWGQNGEGDWDGDAFSNLNEYLTGTNPTNQASFNLTLSASAVNGTVSTNPPKAFYTLNEVVTLTASGSAGKIFRKWTGTFTATNNPLQFAMTTNISLVALFTDPPNPVTATGLGPLQFDSAPTSNDWATLTIGGSPSGITSTGELDSAVQSINALFVTTPILANAGSPPTASANAKWASAGHYLMTRPTLKSWTPLMAALVNDSGAERSAITISYDLRIELPVSEQVFGHMVYYSLSGTPGSWQIIPSISAQTNDNTAGTNTKSAMLNLVSWPVGDLLYLLWADDNGSGSPDTALGIDNFTVSFPAAPPLELTRLAGSQLELAWPFPSSGYTLESTTNLSTASWSTVMETDNPSGGFHRVTIDTTTDQRFFRLRSP